MSTTKQDTICALATARLNCAIHLIRVSGYDCYDIVNKIVNKPIDKANFKIVRRNIVDENNNLVDDVLINCFCNPKSYTGEDLLEINCHGGVYLADKIIGLLIKNGARLAQKGEFSHRALLNNKIDVTQVEAINNLVFAKNDITVSGAINALTGNVTETLNKIAHQLFMIIGQIEVNIDYPEFDDVPNVSSQDVIDILQNVLQQLNQLIKKSEVFLPICEGIKVVIIGEPNVGKSSLMNALIKEDKAIVTDIPGTTRDIIESSINIDGLTLKFYDTAGIRDTTDTIESIGINKAKSLIKDVDLVLWLATANKSHDDVEINQLIKNTKCIKVLTKKDLYTNQNKTNEDTVLISAKNNDINDLITKIKQCFYANDFENKSQIEVLQSRRQLDILKYIYELILNSYNDLKFNNAMLDLVSTNLEISYREINKLLGRVNDYDFLDDLFKNFCLGK